MKLPLLAHSASKQHRVSRYGAHPWLVHVLFLLGTLSLCPVQARTTLDGASYSPVASDAALLMAASVNTAPYLSVATSPTTLSVNATPAPNLPVNTQTSSSQATTVSNANSAKAAVVAAGESNRSIVNPSTINSSTSNSSTFNRTTIEPSIFDYDIKQFSGSEGLDSNAVKSITQDQQGYLWIGTLSGISRFDGKQFTTFQHHQHRQLASSSISYLYTDQQGYIWVGTRSGLSGLDPRAQKFTRFPIMGEVTDIETVFGDEIWVAADNLFRIKQGEVSRVQQIKEPVRQMAVANNTVWVSTAKTLYRLRSDLSVDKFPLPAPLSKHQIHDLKVYSDGLYIASEQGFYRLTAAAQFEAVLPDSGSNPAIYSLLKDSQGDEWAAGYSRILYKGRNASWQDISGESLGLATPVVATFLDKQQNLWLATMGDGLFRITRGQIRRILPKNMADPAVRSLLNINDHSLLVSTPTTLGLLSANEQYQPLPLKQMIGVVYDVANNKDALLLATEQGPLRLQLPSAQLSLLDESLAGIHTRVIQPRKAGGWWIGTAQGLYAFDNNALSRANFGLELDNAVITYVVDNTDRVFIGTSQGAFEMKQKQLIRLGPGTALYDAFINSIQVLPDGGLLLATTDDGLFLQQPDGQWRQYDRTNGLPFEPIVAIAQDHQQQVLWFSSLKGILRLPMSALSAPAPINLQFEQVLTPYDRQLGTPPGRCCNGAGHAKIAMFKQQVWFPTLKGMVAIPDNYQSMPTATVVPIFERIDASQPHNLSGSSPRMLLTTDDRNISIRYSAIDFNKPDALEFRYQLVGFDKDWRYVGSRREAIYTNLPAGEYSFVVQSRNLLQPWQDAQQATLQLVLPRRFNETYVYQGLWALLVFIGLYSLWWFLRRQTFKREQELSVLVKQRTQELETSNARLNELNEQLSQLTHKDGLTGLRNRRFLYEQMPKDTEQYQRNRDVQQDWSTCFAMIQLEIDGFKLINDSYGHNSGDSVLQQVAGLLIRETRGSDYVVRLEAASFAVVLRDVKPEQVLSFVQYINQIMAAEDFMLLDGRSVQLRCSIGFSLYPLALLGGQLISWETSLMLAEQAMLHARLQGRNMAVTIEFDEVVDAFEFEEVQQIGERLESLISGNLARFCLFPCRAEAANVRVFD